MADKIERYHDYFAEATALSGLIRQPFEREIKPLGRVSLGPKGGYHAAQDRELRLESAVSYRSAYTQVGGNRDLKKDHGWTTVATSVIEGLNVFDVVTADRVVSQVSTEHPLVGYVPSISFLGTRIENLRIAGYPVKLDLNLNLFGAKPANDALYTQDEAFMSRVSGQKGHFLAQMSLPADLRQGYNRVPSEGKGAEGVECSLVTSLAPADPSDASFPGRCFGHAIEVPNFGVIYLATVRLTESDPNPETGIPMTTTLELMMVDIRMGCIANGGLGGGGTIVNGSNKP
jgi:hypothetical protein